MLPCFYVSVAGLLALLSIFAAGAFGSFVVRNSDRMANFWANAMAIIGSVWGMIFASSIMATGHEMTVGARHRFSA